MYSWQVRSVSLETKQICAKALLNLVAEDTLPALIQVGRNVIAYIILSPIVCRDQYVKVWPIG